MSFDVPSFNSQNLDNNITPNINSVIDDMIPSFDNINNSESSQLPFNPDPQNVQKHPVFQEQQVQQQVVQEPVVQQPVFQEQPVQQPMQQQVQQQVAQEPVVQQPVFQEQPVQQPMQQQVAQEPVVPQEQSIAQINQFDPEVPVETILTQVSPANFNNFCSLLTALTSSSIGAERILIRQSNITLDCNHSIISADVSQILDHDGKKINLDIVSPLSISRKLSLLRNNNDIFILNDDINKRYIVTNGELRINLPKIDETTYPVVAMPDVSSLALVSQIKIEKEAFTIIEKIKREESDIQLLHQDNKFKGIYFPKADSIYIFKEYITDSKAKKLDETNAELALQCYNFIPLKSEEFTIYICHNQQNDKYVVMQDCLVGGNINARVIEQCDKITGGNFNF